MVLHTVQFSRFVVVSQQQLVYLITSFCSCLLLFFIFRTFFRSSTAFDIQFSARFRSANIIIAKLEIKVNYFFRFFSTFIFLFELLLYIVFSRRSYSMHCFSGNQEITCPPKSSASNQRQRPFHSIACSQGLFPISSFLLEFYFS